MENGVKALIIASSVLIGLMIVSLGVSLYSSLSEYVEFTHKEIANNKIQQFNEQFIKYINYNTSTGETEFTLTIHDVVTAANIANQNKLNTGYTVDVEVEGYPNFQNDVNSNSAEILKKGLENNKKYKCKTGDVIINSTTGRVEKITFWEYTGP